MQRWETQGAERGVDTMDNTMQSDAWHDVDEETANELARYANLELENIGFTL